MVSSTQNSGGRTSVTPPSFAAKQDGTPPTAKPSSSVRCFSYGEIGHRFADCKRGPKKGLFVEFENIQEKSEDVETDPAFDDVVTTE